jgi:hypothetical protein
MLGIIVKLSFAVFWGFFGAAILIAEWRQGHAIAPRPLDISLGWWCVLLSLYNWVRFVLTWSFQQRRARAAPEPAIQTTLARRRSPAELRPPDSSFTAEPPTTPPDSKPASGEDAPSGN